MSPLATCHARPSKSGDFSRIDPKVAYLVADLAREGRFHFHRVCSADEEAMHRLAITYDKLRKTLQQNYARLRALVELVFPEFLKVLKLDSLTAHELLRSHLFPQDFLMLDVHQQATRLMQVSRNQHGRETLGDETSPFQLQTLARHTIGVPLSEVQQRAQRLSATAWLSLIQSLEAQARDVASELVRLSKQTPYHHCIASLKGVSDLLAAFFLAEVRDPARITHVKQIERLAGYNLYVRDSGTYKGRRRISRLGNTRLRWVLFQMASEASKYVPEIRAKYLRRRLGGQKNRDKNVVAVIPQLLALVMALVREKRPYEERPEAVAEVRRLEAELEPQKPKRQARRPGLNAEAA